MTMESGPRQKNTRELERELKEIQQDFAHAMDALNSNSQLESDIVNDPVRNISLGSRKDIEGYMKANDKFLSEPEKNFLLSSLRVKKFKEDNPQIVLK